MPKSIKTPEAVAHYRASWVNIGIPYGYCQCGCGGQTELAPQSSTEKGWLNGEPKKYLLGHNDKGCGFDALTHYEVVAGPLETPCWMWLGTRDKAGYGRLTRSGQNLIAHRFFYEAFKGSIPEDLEVDHLCFVKPCVNPEHLEVVTRSVNCQRRSDYHRTQ